MEEFGEVFKIMQSSNLNKMCMDCKKPYPLFASINNGVFICEKCAEVHRTFGTQISYVRGLKEKWDEYLLSYMERGGNERFLNMMEEFNIGQDEDAFHKYRTKGAENYRLTLRSEVLADEPPERIPSSEGNQLAEIYIDFEPYPEFDNYQLMDEVAAKHLEEQKKGSFFYKVGTFFKKVGNNIEKAAKKVTEKVKEMELGDKIKTTSSKAYIVLKKAGVFVILKSQPVVEVLKEKTKEGLDIISDKAKEGAHKLSEKTKEIYQDIKTKITKRDENTTITNSTLIKGEIPVSDYYELKSQVEVNQNHDSSHDYDINQSHNENIVNYINGDKEDSLPNPERNSFTLLNDSVSQSQEEDHQQSMPTLDEIHNSQIPNFNDSKK